VSRMTRFDWLTRQSRHRTHNNSSRHDRRLRIEPLEDRRMLANFAVTHFGDGPVAAFGQLPGSLRQAIFDANASAGADTIGIVAGTGTIFLIAGPMDISEDVTITEVLGAELTIHGNGNRIFNIDDGNNGVQSDVEINGVTLTGAGGAINGGAIYSREDLTITDSTISGNSASSGGAAFFNYFGTTTVTNSTISNNSSNRGAILNTGTTNINSSTLSGNTATGQNGGAIHNYVGTTNVTDSTITGNSAGGGGGIYLRDGTATVTNSTISGNSAGGVGGGVYLKAGMSTVTHSTITDNSSTGGGFFTAVGSSLTLGHSLVAGNSGGFSADEVAAFGTVTLTGYNLLGDNSKTTGDALTGVTLTGTDITATSDGTDPTPLASILDTTLADNGGTTLTHALVTGSPAIDAGNPGIIAPPISDQRGAPFVREDGTIDIGAYEHQTLAPAFFVVTTTNDEFDYTNGDVSLREAIHSAKGSVGADTITFDAGLSGGTIMLAGTELEITETLTIDASALADNVTIDAQQNSRVLHFSSATGDLILHGLTIQNGSAAGNGGGIAFLSDGTLTLNQTVVSGNSAQSGVPGTGGNGSHGGGIFTSAGTIVLNQSTVSGNQAGDGGQGTFGSYVPAEQGGNGGQSGHGGGIYSSAGAVTLYQSTISGNRAGHGGDGGGGNPNGEGADGGNGGGIYAGTGTVTLLNSTISDNHAGDGGTTNGTSSSGIDGSGGGLWSNSGDIISEHSTVTQNSGNNSGGIRASASADVTISNSIVAENIGSAPDISTATANLMVDFSLIGDNTGTTLSEAQTADANGNLIGSAAGAGIIDPLLGSLADNGGPTHTHTLLPGSPAIDAGDPLVASPPANDQRGVPFPRIVNVIDIGAVESLKSLVVDTLVDETNGDYSTNDLSLREALELTNANPGADTVSFDGSLALGTINLDMALGQLEISADVTVTGLGADQLSVDAGGNSRVLHISGGTVDISGLTISGGSADQGGGIKNESGATTSLTDMLIQGNTATINSYSAGGGVWNDGNLTITSSTLANNLTTVGIGSGAGAWNGGTLMIVGSTITGNSSVRDGGGLYSNAFGSGVTITDSTISDNDAGDDAGGIFIYLGTNSIIGSTISGNTAAGDDGGGIWSFGNLDITNSTISGNSAADLGGGWIDIQDAPTTILHSTVTGNSAASGGGIYLQGAVLTLDHTIVANNTAPTGPDIEGAVTANWSLIEDTTDAVINGANNITGMGPMLDVLADNGGPTLTHALVAGSPAINAGDSGFTSPPDYDQRGAPFERVRIGVIDIGAIEQARFPFVVDTDVDENDGVHTPGNLSLREAIGLAQAQVDHDTIEFDVSLAGSTINLDIALGQLTINDDVTIIGLGADELTVDAGGNSRVLKISEGTVNISGLTISGGNAQQGGGIKNELGTTTTLTEMVISSNTATAAGTSTGGGGGLWNDGDLTITSSTISGNTVLNDPLRVYGGGILTASGTYLTIVGTTISGNSLVSSNASSRGSGLWSDGTTVIQHSTITGNSGPSFFSVGIVAGSNGNMTLDHTIVANTMGGDADLSGTVTANWSLIENPGFATINGADNITGDDPMLDVLADNGGPTPMHALLPGSPAINAGDLNAVAGVGDVPLLDQRGSGFSRVALSRIDIGAFERQNESADFDLDGVVSGFDFLKWQLGFGTTGTAVHGDGDANFDTDVNNADLDIWELQYGNAAPLVAAASAPLAAEPLFANSDLADVALALALVAETDEVSDTSGVETEQSMLETFANELTGDSNTGAKLLRESSSNNSVGEDSEQAEDGDFWEEVADQAFAAML